MEPPAAQKQDLLKGRWSPQSAVICSNCVWNSLTNLQLAKWNQYDYTNLDMLNQEGILPLEWEGFDLEVFVLKKYFEYKPVSGLLFKFLYYFSTILIVLWIWLIFAT